MGRKSRLKKERKEAALLQPAAAPESAVVSSKAAGDGLVLFAVILCFVLSGFAALLYQTAWMRQFSIVFGTSELAVATVLSAYMAGLALGATVASRFVDRITRPVLVYGILEGAIALSALAVPSLLGLAHLLYVAVLGGQPEPVDASGLGQSFFYLGVGFVVLAIPTACMGATLPMLTRYVVRSDEQVGSRVGLLYSTNTLGAVGGTLVAGLVLLPVIGLNGTVYVGVAVNIMVFAIAAMIARAVPSLPSAETVEPAGQVEEDTARPIGFRRPSWVLPLMLLSGANAFIYEVLWTRLLAHVLGGSVAAFSAMLASFLGGIAIGSAIASRLARNRLQATTGFVVIQIGIAITSVLIYQNLGVILDATPGLRGNVMLAVTILLPATLFIGASFPLAVRILADDAADAPRSSARVYSWNTVGAIAGATLAAFFLIPALRYEGAVQFAVLMNLSLAVFASLLILERQRRLMTVSLIALVAATIFYRPAIPEDILRASPIIGQRDGDIRYYEVGRSATVLMLEADGYLNLRTNGLPEASTNLKGAPPYKHNQPLLSIMPILARPDAESMLVVGFGGGAALEGVPPSVKGVDVIELEPKVIEANRTIGDERKSDPLADTRINLIINDARSALALTDKRYDAIVSQPSHPWTAGASHLYTKEFIQLARNHLADDGVYLQWMNSQFVDEALLRSLTATMVNVFPHVRVYQWNPEILFFLGSAEPIEPERTLAVTGRPLADHPGFYREKGIGSLEDLVVALTMDHENAVAFAGSAELLTDNDNRMATQSARAMERRETLVHPRLIELLLDYDPLLQADSNIHTDFPVPLNFPYISRRLEGLRAKQRAIDLSATLDELQDASGLVLIGLGLEAQGEREESQRTLLAAVKAAPGNQQARFALLQPWIRQIFTAKVPQYIADELQNLKGPAAAVLAGWQAALQQDWQRLAALDADIAKSEPSDLWYLTAVKLRVDWRNKVTTPGMQPGFAREAKQLIDNAIAVYQDADFYSMRVASAYIAGDHLDVVETSRRLAMIFDVEVDLAETGEVKPTLASIDAKIRQIENLGRIVQDVGKSDDVPEYKIRNLEQQLELLIDRLKRVRQRAA